jgi:hypothetical protein
MIGISTRLRVSTTACVGDGGSRPGVSSLSSCSDCIRPPANGNGAQALGGEKFLSFDLISLRVLVVGQYDDGESFHGTA